ncbi:PHA/PHB synthase family protein [Sphingomonas profundi]|uniref:PHA/PHB synthase family protein n=1 Tax=Alterirhizorhabdus profundi TaxID=2681549 RepID=UPI001E5BE6C2|nr:class I poly(R)-hydroxyalkanoic acid synthase [Sphingomonas profundi]
MPSLNDLQYWTGMIGRAQQMMLEALSEATMKAEAEGASGGAAPALPALVDAAGVAHMQADFWQRSADLWQRFLQPGGDPHPLAAAADADRRFSSPHWRDSPVFDMIRQSYLMIADHMLKSVEALDGVDERQREQLRFATRSFTDAMSPSNFFLTNPQVLERTFATKGANLLKGLEYMLTDLKKGQLTHTDPNAFEVGRNVAATPGKVVKETPLYQLIQYSPTTETVYETPLVIFPPWINRFYILDLNPQKSFIRWAVEQGLTVFVVSWKSADASLIGVTMEDYVLRGQLDAIETVRDLLGVEAVHTIGYCVAGTNLAALLAWLAARGEAGKVASATFFTAQVDFSRSGDLKVFIDDEQMKMIEAIAGDAGYLDGRYMAVTFNLLRGRDLIWSYVVNNYLMGEDYPPFDLLHWNSDTTNLPLKWHQAYLADLYRDNKLVEPGAITLDGTPIDLTKVETPSYIQAGREDHIAPAESVWKITDHFRGPLRFLLAGSGHIAGVVNPPISKKYQYWINEAKVGSLDEFIAGATETKGSWWPDWIAWIDRLGSGHVDAAGARIPGAGKLPAIEDAPGRYVRMR